MNAFWRNYLTGNTEAPDPVDYGSNMPPKLAIQLAQIYIMSGYSAQAVLGWLELPTMIAEDLLTQLMVKNRIDWLNENALRMVAPAFDEIADGGNGE